MEVFNHQTNSVVNYQKSPHLQRDQKIKSTGNQNNFFV